MPNSSVFEAGCCDGHGWAWIECAPTAGYFLQMGAGKGWSLSQLVTEWGYGGGLFVLPFLRSPAPARQESPARVGEESAVIGPLHTTHAPCHPEAQRRICGCSSRHSQSVYKRTGCLPYTRAAISSRSWRVAATPSTSASLGTFSNVFSAQMERARRLHGKVQLRSTGVVRSAAGNLKGDRPRKGIEGLETCEENCVD